MLYGPAAEIIVDQIINYLNHMQEPGKIQPNPLPNPETFFHT